MRCSKCGFDNPEGMKFCGQCTNALNLICPKCSCENPPGFKFCGQCPAPFGIVAKSFAEEAEVRERAHALGLSSEEPCL
jgi:Double zinc ribbon